MRGNGVLTRRRRQTSMFLVHNSVTLVGYDDDDDDDDDGDDGDEDEEEEED